MKVLIGQIGLRLFFLVWVISTSCAAYYAYQQNGHAFALWLCGKVIGVAGMLQFGVGLWMAKDLRKMEHRNDWARDEIDDELEQMSVERHNKSYYQGVRDALRMYAWWRDGEQFVGTQDDKKFVGCGVRTLREALEEVDKWEHRDNENGSPGGIDIC